MSKRSAALVSRHNRSLALVTVVAAIVGGWLGQGSPAADAAPATDPPNLLDHPRVDVAILDRTSPDAVPALLVVDPVEPGALGARLRVLERSGAWAAAADATVDLGPVDPGVADQPWLIGLGGDRFALIATEPASSRSLIVMLAVIDAAGGPAIIEMDRLALDDVIDDAGAADVIGDGSLDLVVAAAHTTRQGGTCQGSTLWAFADGRSAARTSLSVPDVRLAAGVLGSFDDVAGDDLAVYAYPNCPAGPDNGRDLRLLTFRLADGTIVSDRAAAGTDPAPTWVGPPVRLDAGGDGRHELLALAPRGLAVVDPRDRWSDLRVGTTSAYPLVAIAPDRPLGEVPIARIALLEPLPDGRGSIAMQDVRRSDAGALLSGPTEMWSSSRWLGRWDLVVAAAAAGATRQAPPVGLSLVGPGASTCAGALVPTAAIGCVGSTIDEGPAWIGTRPLAFFGDPRSRVALVASGSVLEAGTGLPATPTPWAGWADGAWRHGPSVQFELAEVDGTEAGPEGSLPPTTVAAVSGAGPSAGLGGRAGLRLVVGTTPVTSDARDPGSPTIDEVAAAFGAPTSGAQLIRLDVPPGSVSGTGRTEGSVPLDDIAPGAEGRATRWSVTMLPVSDVGEVGPPVIAPVIRDTQGPAVAVVMPFTSPVWPVAATLRGTTEPGASVAVDGGGSVTTPDGAFEFQAALAPWPQSLRLTATDPSGNQTVHEVSVVGGVDYRQFPWTAIVVVVVLAAVIVTGAIGTRRRDDSVPAPAGIGDASPGPELEELTPGDGI